MDYEETEGKSSISCDNLQIFQKCSNMPQILKKHRFFGTICPRRPPECVLGSGILRPKIRVNEVFLTDFSWDREEY